MQTALHAGGQPVHSTEMKSPGTTRQVFVTVGLQLSEPKAEPTRGVMAKPRMYGDPGERRVVRADKGWHPHSSRECETPGEATLEAEC